MFIEKEVRDLWLKRYEDQLHKLFITYIIPEQSERFQKIWFAEEEILIGRICVPLLLWYSADKDEITGGVNIMPETLKKGFLDEIYHNDQFFDARKFTAFFTKETYDQGLNETLKFLKNRKHMLCLTIDATTSLWHLLFGSAVTIFKAAVEAEVVERQRDYEQLCTLLEVEVLRKFWLHALATRSSLDKAKLFYKAIQSREAQHFKDTHICEECSLLRCDTSTDDNNNEDEQFVTL